jgi:SH3 domain protein
MYVGDITKLNLRSGKGVKYRVIQTLDSGEKVTVISTVNEWTKVGTMNGNEGWVASEYLTIHKPANIKIEVYCHGTQMVSDRSRNPSCWFFSGLPVKTKAVFSLITSNVE